MNKNLVAEPSLQERAEANHAELFRAMARVSPHGQIIEDSELMLVVTGPLLPMLNFARLRRPPADPAATLTRAREFFGRAGMRFMLSTSGAAADAIAAAASAAGMEPFDEEPGMLLAPLVGERPQVPGLAIEVVRDREAMVEHIDTMTEGFGGGPWALSEILTGTALFEVPDATYYTGFMDGRPVATAMRITSHRVAGVFNVSTIPEYRRRGIGEAITARAALDGRAEGCLASYLTASEMGRSTYERIGYRHAVTYRRWLSPPL